jgi:hypothetical protein
MKIKLRKDNPNLPDSKTESIKEISPVAYPLYPYSEDIYNRFKEEKDIDPEDISKQKVSEDDESDFGLDVPGSELDDAEEKIGSEDEENNYYSIGGDNHNKLDEDNG